MQFALTECSLGCRAQSRGAAGLPAPARSSLHESRLRRSIRSYAWLESRAETKANVPQSFAFEVFEDRESIPKYMSWIQEVKNTGENTSSWMLRQDAFGRTWEVSWLALNLPPIPDQKIHWESVPGSTQGSGGIQVQNKGEVRFMQLSEKACKVRLAVQFEVPPPLLPFGPLLTPLVSGIIQSDMQEFARYAQRKYALQQQRAQREAKA